MMVKLDNLFLQSKKDLNLDRAVQIDRSKDKGPKFTDLGGKHLYGRKGAQNNSSFLVLLSRTFAHWRQPKKYDV